MRWYFAIDEAGGHTDIGAHAKLAVQSARAAGGLEPVLLYYGNRTAFTDWMAKNGVTIIDAVPNFIDTIRAAEAANTFKAHSIGHWLRIGIPLIETRDEFVLYTDCDVVFLRPVDWAAIRPKVFAAAPEFKLNDWGYFNSGVLVLNVPAMRKTYGFFEAEIRARIVGGPAPYDDQVALNSSYRGHWERLDPLLNWKPYWGYHRAVSILHFHGPKIAALEAIAAGRWQRVNPTAVKLGEMLDTSVGDYITWCNTLGDRLQIVDVAAALRFAAVASALTAYRKQLEQPASG